MCANASACPGGTTTTAPSRTGCAMTCGPTTKRCAVVTETALPLMCACATGTSPVLYADPARLGGLARNATLRCVLLDVGTVFVVILTSVHATLGGQEIYVSTQCAIVLAVTEDVRHLTCARAPVTGMVHSA